MGKKRKNNDASKNLRKQKQNDADIFFLDYRIQEKSLIGWLVAKKYYVIMCLLVGVLVGSGLGTAVFVTQTPRMILDIVVFQPINSCFNMFSFTAWANFLSKSGDEDGVNAPYKYFTFNGKTIRDDASHPLTFAILRESIIRQKGGFVHPDLGVLSPAPSGASRGLGMVRETYNTCQVRCMPGTASGKMNSLKIDENKDSLLNWNTRQSLQSILDEQDELEERFRQEEVLLKIPLSMQMTRSRAIETLLPLMPKHVLARTPLLELDDAALLVLLLANEHGLGIESEFHPYISSLPLTPSCGFSPLLRTEALETISIMGVELGMDVHSWPGELSKASDRAQIIIDGLTRDYGNYIRYVEG